jgi:hypothetical protein
MKYANIQKKRSFSFRFFQKISVSLLMILAVAIYPVTSAEAQSPPLSLQHVQELPADLNIVLDSTLNLLTNPTFSNSDVWPTQYSPQALKGVRDPLFSFEGFYLRNVFITQYELSKTSPDTVLAGLTVELVDQFSRRALVAFSFEFKSQKMGIFVSKAISRPIIASNPKFRLFIVAENNIPNSFWKSNPNYTNTLSMLLKHAVDPKRPETFVRGKQKYIVFALGQDRMSPLQGLLLVASNDPNSSKGSAVGSKAYDFDGWRLATLTGKFSLDDPQAIYFKTLYRPDVRQTKTNAKVLGVFSSQLIKTQSAQSVSTPKASVSGDNKNDPARGLADLISLSDINNVHRVHMRLSQLGFYEGDIDTKWAKASRAALRKFKVTNGLEDSAVWDGETQEVLFP